MSGSKQISAPARITGAHNVGDFDCGEPALDDWLKKRALRNESANASRTYVICAEQQVVGYYCLATASAVCSYVPGKLRRNMPDPLTVMVLGRLAIDRAWQGHGLGRALLRDAVLRTFQVSEIAALKALMVHALSPKAAQFYLQQGFHASPIDPAMLFLPVSEISASLQAS